MKNRTLKVLKLVLENLPAIITALATLLTASPAAMHNMPAPHTSRGPKRSAARPAAACCGSTC